MLISAIQQSTFCYTHILFHYGSSQDLEHSPLCYTVRPCCLFILLYIYQLASANSKLPIHPSPTFFPPWQPQVSESVQVSCVSSFVSLFQIPHLSDIQYLFLTDFTQCDNLQLHPCSYRWHYFILFLWLSSIPLYLRTTCCMCCSLSTHLSTDIQVIFMSWLL